MSSADSFPQIEGFRFRRFMGPSDFEVMSKVSRRSWLADGFEFVRTAEEFAGVFSEIKSRDPYEDLVFIEVGTDVVGYGECYL